jgi:hypothetical protein
MNFLPEVEPMQVMGLLLIAGSLIGLAINRAGRRGRKTLCTWLLAANLILAVLAILLALQVIQEAAS